MEETNEAPSLETYDIILQDGIFNMVVTLCQHKANSLPMAQAKEEVAQWLDKISNGLRTQQESKID